MNPFDHLKYIRELAERDGRYAPEAFMFVSEAIAYTAQWLRDGELEENDPGGVRGGGSEFHVSGRELLAGIKRLASERWGMMAPAVLANWRVYRTEDFGEIVFCMVEDETMQWKKRECDRREDFADGYDFSEAFSDI